MERYSADDMAQKAQGIASDVQGKVKDVLKNVQAEVGGRVDAAKDYVDELRAKDASEIFEELGGVVKDHPVATIASCLVLGYFIGRLFGSKS